MPNMSQMRVCSADLAFAAFLGAGASALFKRTGGLLPRVAVFRFALAFGFALSGAALRFFAGALAAFAFGAADLRFFAGAFVVLF